MENRGLFAGLVLIGLFGWICASPPLATRGVMRMSQPRREVWQDPVGTLTLLDVAKEQHLYGLLTLTDATGITNLLAGPGPMTIFAPNDRAIQDDLNPEFKMLLTKNLTLLNQTLFYHVTTGRVMAADLKNNMAVRTLQGATIRVSVLPGANNTEEVTMNGANVVKADVMASNGVLHIINQLLFPIPKYDFAGLFQANPKLYSMVAGLIQKAGLADTINGGVYTMFAPINVAFQFLPKDVMQKLNTDMDFLRRVLTYHLLAGARYPSTLPAMTPGWIKTVQGGMVVVAQEEYGPGASIVIVNDCQGQMTNAITNGVIYDMHCVLLPPPM